MLHLSRRVDTPEDVDAFLSSPILAGAIAEARSVLVQVFWSSSGSIGQIAEAILRRVPEAVLVGADSAGQISDGLVSSDGTVLSVSCFAQARLEPLFLDIGPGGEGEAGRGLGASLSRSEDIKAALLLVPTLSLDAAALVRGLREGFPSPLIFGGGAAQKPGPGKGVLFGTTVSARGVVAVALCGPDLHAELRTLFDWRPLGPPVVLTEVESGCIRRIDGLPAFEHYRKNLAIQRDEDLYLLEFPLLLEREGRLFARNPLSVEADGGIRINADAFTGESARLGYLDVGALGASIRRTVADLRRFGPEAVFIYSCVCRLYTLQDETEMETLPFQSLAPTSGFFTSGEFCRLWDEAQLLNSSEVVVALREGPAPSQPIEDDGVAFLPANSSGERHIRMTSSLLHFIGELTESLGEEVAERARAEGRANAISAEKENLLRELQHRVKNSMAIISSIASLEAGRTKTAEAREVLVRLESRIAALASLYDILYFTGSIEEIGLSDYLGRVVDFAAASLGADARGIAVVREIISLPIDVKRAISLGIIVNELVTDGIKYAFPEGRKGRLEVSLSRDGPELVLVVSDDGVGLRAGLAGARESGFGLTLVRSLASGLDASFSMQSERGARFELRMPR